MPSPETLVQPIILLIDKDAPPSHEDAIKSIATAAVDALANDSRGDFATQEIWVEWLSGPFTKTVRRANPKQWAKIPSAVGEASFGLARAAAFRPVTYEAMDKSVSRLQVSGTELDPGASYRPDSRSPVLILNSSLGMTTGKAAAQAAHALMAYYLGLNSLKREAWAAAGRPFNLLEESQRFASLSALALQHTVIRDNGLTEVAPGSATAMVLESADDLP